MKKPKRLTRKVNYSGEHYGSPNGIPCDNLKHLEKVYTKLGQFEDIEEELRIDLIKYFKAIRKQKGEYNMLYCVFRKISYTPMTPVIKAVFSDYKKAVEYIKSEFAKNKDTIDSTSNKHVFVGNEYCYEICEVVVDI